MLQPKRTKFRKMQKGRIKGNAQRGAHIAFGSFGIKAMEEGFITSRQIEAARIAVTRYMKRQGNVWIRIFPDKPITSKPAEVRMGKGKGAPSHWVAIVKPGRIMFEADGVPFEVAKEAMRLASQKLPIKTKFVVRKDYQALNQIETMTQGEITELSTPELIENLDEKVILLDKLNLTHSVSEDENPIRIRYASRTVARIKTELRKRELAEAAK